MDRLKMILFSLVMCIMATVEYTESSTTEYPAEGCPHGWIDSIEGCFLFYFAKVLTWEDAQLECEKLGGFLAETKRKEQTELLVYF